MKTTLVLALLLVASSAHAFGRKSVVLDTQPAAILSDDLTALVEGCGAQPIAGFTFCRQVEGDAANSSLTFIGPPAKCQHADACVFIKVFDNQGKLAWGGSIPSGHTRVIVPWRVLLGCAPSPAVCAFQLGSRGTWDFNEQVFYNDPEGHERSSIAQGEIRLRIYKQGYTPLDSVQDDPNFAWTWVDGAFLYKMTSSLRAYVGRVK